MNKENKDYKDTKKLGKALRKLLFATRSLAKSSNYKYLKKECSYV